MAKSTAIERLASDVVDTGRRGEPRPGCDCMQCFGFCMVDRDAAVREAALAKDGGRNKWGRGGRTFEGEASLLDALDEAGR